jgi:hypothetical protein
MRNVKSTLVILTALAVSATAHAQAGGNGNGGSGGGNAHGAATAAPTVGGDNTSTPTSNRKAPHFKHKKHSKAMQQDAQ